MTGKRGEYRHQRELMPHLQLSMTSVSHHIFKEFSNENLSNDYFISVHSCCHLSLPASFSFPGPGGLPHHVNFGGLISVFPGSRHHCLRCECWVFSLCFAPSLHGSSNNMTSSRKTYVHCISLSHLSKLVKPRGCLSVVVFPKTQDEWGWNGSPLANWMCPRIWVSLLFSYLWTCPSQSLKQWAMWHQ